MATRDPEPPLGPDDELDRRAGDMRAMISTSRHAQMLFETVVAALGDDAVVETRNGRTALRVFRRDRADRNWIVPWPLIDLSFGPSASIDVPLGDEIEEWAMPKREAKPPPNLRGLGRADLEIVDGWSRFGLRCGEDGRTFESSTAGRRVLDLLAAVRLDRSAHSIELLAERIVALTPDGAGPGRVQMPVPLPSGVEGTFGIGLTALRQGFWRRQVPMHARVAVTDGYTGKAIAFAATQDSAITALHAQIRAQQPRPRPPQPPPPKSDPLADPTFADLPDAAWSGWVEMRAPAPDVPWPEPALANTPIVSIPVEPPPARACPFGAWVGLLDRFGNIEYAALRHDPDGFTLVDAALLDDLNLTQLDAQLDTLDAAFDQTRRKLLETWPSSAPRRECSITSYTLRDAYGKRTPPHLGPMTLSPTYDMGHFEATSLRGCVVRQRWIGPLEG